MGAMSEMAMFQQLSEFTHKIDHFPFVELPHHQKCADS
jgi:hypothetical protein